MYIPHKTNVTFEFWGLFHTQILLNERHNVFRLNGVPQFLLNVQNVRFSELKISNLKNTTNSQLRSNEILVVLSPLPPIVTNICFKKTDYLHLKNAVIAWINFPC